MNPFYEIIEASKPWNSPELLVKVPAQFGPNSSSLAHPDSKPAQLNLIKKGFRICIFDQDESSVFYGHENTNAIASATEERCSPRTRRMTLRATSSSTSESNNLYQDSNNMGEADVNASSNAMSIMLPRDPSWTAPTDMEPMPPDIVSQGNEDLNEESTREFNTLPSHRSRRSVLKVFYDDKGRKRYMPIKRGSTNTSVVPSLVPRLNIEHPVEDISEHPVEDSDTSANDGTEEITKRRR